MPDNYGPPRPESTNHDLTHLRTPSYLRGHANKIIYDLSKKARLYNGRLVKIYDTGTGARCPVCTDDITGASVLHNCPHCFGTGTNPRTYLGEYWAHIDFNPEFRISGEYGNTENPGGNRDTFVVIGAPTMRDRWLIIAVDTKDIYKIIDVEPQMVAMQGIVITQIASTSKLPEGSVEYKLVDW